VVTYQAGAYPTGYKDIYTPNMDLNTVMQKSLKVKVKGQGHHVGTKTGIHFSALSAAYVRFGFGKTYLAYFLLIP